MKTTFDLPDPLLRKAKAAAAEQGRPLRDLVTEALQEKLSALALPNGGKRGLDSEWKAFEARLVKLPDGSYLNPEIAEGEGFPELLDSIRKDGPLWEPKDPFKAFTELDADAPVRLASKAA